MYHSLCTKLALDAAGSFGQSPEFSQAVSMNGGNAVQWEAVVFHTDTGGVAFRLQVSHDLETWTSVGSAQATLGVGHTLFTAETGIAAAYVRLKYTKSKSGKAILAAGINISSQ